LRVTTPNPEKKPQVSSILRWSKTLEKRRFFRIFEFVRVIRPGLRVGYSVDFVKWYGCIALFTAPSE